MASETEQNQNRPTRTGRGEAYWRSRAQRLRAAVANLEREVSQLDAKATNLAYGAKTVSALAAARQELDGLDDAARMDGALPGWLR